MIELISHVANLTVLVNSINNAVQQTPPLTNSLVKFQAIALTILIFFVVCYIAWQVKGSTVVKRCRTEIGAAGSHWDACELTPLVQQEEV